MKGKHTVSLTFCTLGSGSKGNSYLIATEKNKILVDAGLSAKHICTLLAEIGVTPNELNGIIVTHEHSDHVAGTRVLSKKFGIPLYANEKTLSEIIRKYNDIDSKNLRTFTNGESFYIGGFDILPFKTPHDSVSSCGFSVYSGINKVTVATDIGHMTRNVLENLKNSDILVLEANHDIEMLINGPYNEFLKQRVQGPNGHLSNDVCGKTLAYLLDYGLNQVILAHLSEENNTPECAYETVSKHLNERGAKDGKDVFIEVASQYKRGKCYRIV
ncbi:MAG: MBL fold metallo-hydrolase [Clostridia bacterium]|nr:MBL fold metallo-hydrolase [Clostridia bacterium]